jgi:hypothetical protein
MERETCIVVNCSLIVVATSKSIARRFIKFEIQNLVLGEMRVLGVNTGIPSVLESRVVRMGTRLAGQRVKILTVSSLGNGIVIPEQTALAQLGNEQIDNLLEGAGLDGVCL